MRFLLLVTTALCYETNAVTWGFKNLFVGCFWRGGKALAPGTASGWLWSAEALRPCAMSKISGEVRLLLLPTPPSQQLFCSQWRWLHCLLRVCCCVLLQSISLERFLQGPWASCLYRYVPWVNSFWHHISLFSTGQPPLVLYSAVSVVSSAVARHRNLSVLPPFLLPPESFSGRSPLSFFLITLLCSRHAGLVPSTYGHFYGRDHNPLGPWHKFSWLIFLSSLSNQRLRTLRC